MRGGILHWVLIWLALLPIGGVVSAQESLNPAGAPRYGNQTLAAGFRPDPLTIEVVSGGDINIKALQLGDNCLGFAAADPDFVVELSERQARITFLIAAAEDTTLVIKRPDGNWSCNDDTNGVNPALVYFNALPGAYRLWIGSYAQETYSDAILHISSAGPEALPTTATGPDPARAALYGEVTLTPGFQPDPYTIQLIGGGRSRANDFLADAACRGYISEAPDFSVLLSEGGAALWFAARSPADMTLIVNAADGSWHCSDDYFGSNPGIAFSYAAAGLYDIWVGSAEAGNYAAAVFSVSETAPEAGSVAQIDANCPGLPATDLQVGARATVSREGGNPVYLAIETASTQLHHAATGSSMRLVGGPVCADEYRWWRVEFSAGGRGWIADGDVDSRWLERGA